MDDESTSLHRFTTRAVIAAVALVTVYALARAAWLVASTLLVLYLAVIVGVGLRGAANAIARRTPLGVGPALALVVLVVFGAPLGAAGVFGAQISDQLSEAKEQLPELEERLDDWLAKAQVQVKEATGASIGIVPPRDGGRDQPAAPPQPGAKRPGGKDDAKEPEKKAGTAPQANEAKDTDATKEPAPATDATNDTDAPQDGASEADKNKAGAPTDAAETPGSTSETATPTQQVVEKLQSGPASQIFGWIAGFVGGVSQAILGAVLVSVLGIYLASSPDLYRRGLVLLVPIRHRRRVDAVLSELTEQLQAWIVAQLIAVIVVSAVTTIGLLLLGVPMALLLGLLAGLLDFIPNFGPAIAAVPAALVAAGVGKVWPVLIFYGVIQVAEGYLLRPFIEKRAVDTPPALLIASQVVIGTIAGFMGLLMAPALLVLFTLFLQRFYIEDFLGDDLGDDDG